jgi:hypothetical protein
MCGCDYPLPSVYWQTVRKARKPHRCVECGCMIAPGIRYEHVRGVWEGEPNSYKTCLDCVGLRNLLSDCEPCFCWGHGGLWDDVENVVREIEPEDVQIGVQALWEAMRERNRKAVAERRAA